MSLLREPFGRPGPPGCPGLNFVSAISRPSANGRGQCKKPRRFAARGALGAATGRVAELMNFSPFRNARQLTRELHVRVAHPIPQRLLWPQEIARKAPVGVPLDVPTQDELAQRLAPVWQILDGPADAIHVDAAQIARQPILLAGDRRLVLAAGAVGTAPADAAVLLTSDPGAPGGGSADTQSIIVASEHVLSADD